MLGDPRRAALAAGICAALAGAATLALIDDDFDYRLEPARAVNAALQDPGVRARLREHPHTRSEVNALDEDLQRVSFFDGHALLLDAAVDEGGRTRHVTQRFQGKPPSGSEIAHHPLVWALLGTLFFAALVGRPRRNLRTLDALAMTAFLGAVATYNLSLVAAPVWIGAGLLAYLGVRCWQVALARTRRPAPQAGPPGAVRATRNVALGAAALVVIVSLTSPGESDVAFASMAGATLLADGISPYGHMPPEVVHGDTYPLLTYVLHLPAALWLPVRDSFSDLTGALFVATASALGAGWAIHRAGRAWGALAAWRHALAWFAFPPVVMATSSGTNDLLVAAAIAFALALPASHALTAGALATGAWIKLAPLFVLPLWLAHVGRTAAARALAAVVVLSAGCLAVLVALGGPGEVGDMLEAVGFQAERGSLYSISAQLDAEWLQHAARGVVAGVASAAAVFAARSPDLRRDPVRLAGLVAAVLIAVQLSANYWTFAYLPWLVPPLLISLFPFSPGVGPPRAASRGVPGG